MAEKTILLPRTDNPPAKVKDKGVINLVKAGGAAYNAKSGELLLLPLAETRRREIILMLCNAFSAVGIQHVNCGSDHSIFTIAERYLKDWGELARSFSDERNRNIHLLGWCENENESSLKIEAVKNSLHGALDSIYDFFFVKEILDSGFISSSLVSFSDSDALMAREAFSCSACGRIYFPDTPAEFRVSQPGADEAEEKMEDIETPGANTIAELCAQHGIDITKTLKAMLYVAFDDSEKPKPVAVFVRGDFHVSKNKLSYWLKRTHGLFGLKTADRSELFSLIGEVAGYCGPVGLPDNVITVCDESVRGSKNTVVGANRPGYHRKGCCHGRDFDMPIADIAQVSADIPCPCGGANLKSIFLRTSGSIISGDSLFKKTGTIDEKVYKRLASKGRDGSIEYPIEWMGDISVESIILAECSKELS